MQPSRFQSHPWHGIPPGDDCPEIVTAYIEIVPTDTVKYEVDKASGHLKIDRPQKFSNVYPAPYGFIPQTYCGAKIAAFAAKQAGNDCGKGDGDPLDICVLTEHHINQGGILLRARPIGGLRMFDNGEADDKIIAVLLDDPAYGGFRDMPDVPTPLIDRLRHFFLTYKLPPDPQAALKRGVEIPQIYGREDAHAVIRLSLSDYQDRFASPSA